MQKQKLYDAETSIKTLLASIASVEEADELYKSTREQLVEPVQALLLQVSILDVPQEERKRLDIFLAENSQACRPLNLLPQL